MTGSERDERDFREAARLHQTGDLAGAIRAYDRLLKRFPKHANLLNLQGLAYFQAGQFEPAAAQLQKAAALDPRIPDVHYNLATVLHRLGRFADALPHFEKAVAARPDDADARNNLGTALKSLGRMQEARAAFERAIALAPRHAAAHVNLGNTLSSLNDEAAARASFEKSIILDPGNPDAFLGLGKLLLSGKEPAGALAMFEKALALNPDVADGYFFRGTALASLKRFDEAAGNFLRATKLKPDFAEAHLELGNALMQLREFEKAAEAYRSAIQHKPDFAEAYSNLGNVLQGLERFEESIEPSRKALELQPKFAQALTNLGIALVVQQKYDEARGYFEKSLAIEPSRASTLFAFANLLAETDDDAAALQYLQRAVVEDPDSEVSRSWNMGYFCLGIGQWDPGWKLHEYRFDRYKGDVKLINYRDYSAPRWNGERLSGTLLAWGEQGLGDQIIWAGLLPEARARAVRMIAECEPRLVPLFTRSFQNIQIVPLDEDKLYEGRIDAHTPFASLGKFLRPDWSSFPKLERGFLTADEARVKSLRMQIAGDGRRAVGLSWKSNNPFFGQAKTAQLRDFESIFNVAGCRFVDLQYGDTSGERAGVLQEFGVDVSPVAGIDNTKDIDGLAALIEACDAVVTTSNTTAHLAGALGKKTFVVLPASRGRLWYWLKERTDSPWYANVTLIRQSRGEPWSSVAIRAAVALSAFLDSR